MWFAIKYITSKHIWMCVCMYASLYDSEEVEWNKREGRLNDGNNRKEISKLTKSDKNNKKALQN